MMKAFGQYISVYNLNPERHKQLLFISYIQSRMFKYSWFNHMKMSIAEKRTKNCQKFFLLKEELEFANITFKLFLIIFLKLLIRRKRRSFHVYFHIYFLILRSTQLAEQPSHSVTRNEEDKEES